MIITVLVSVSIGYFLGYQWAKHFSLSGMLWNLQKRGVLYKASYCDHDVFDEVLGDKKAPKRERYFLSLHSAQKWVARKFCESKIKFPAYTCNAWVLHKGKTIAEFYC